MASTTTNLGLTKPATSEAYNVSVQNNNMDLIDAKFGAVNGTVESNLGQKASVSKYPNSNKVLSISTDGSSVGFRIQYPSSGAFSIFYADIYGRVAHIYRPSGNANLQMINGTFNATSLNETDTFLNVGNWVRAQMIITASDGTLDNIQVGTYSS